MSLASLKTAQLGPKVAPIDELPESPKPYSPLILPDFNEEEYMNQPAEEDGEEAQVNEFAEHGRETTTEETGEATTGVGETSADVGEAAAQDPPNEL